MTRSDIPGRFPPWTNARSQSIPAAVGSSIPVICHPCPDTTLGRMELLITALGVRAPGHPSGHPRCAARWGFHAALSGAVISRHKDNKTLARPRHPTASDPTFPERLRELLLEAAGDE